MDQKSFSVLLSFVQSWPLAGGLISGVVASAANPAIAQRSRAIPTTIFLMATLSEDADPAEICAILPKKHNVQSLHARDTIAPHFGQQRHRGRRRHRRACS